ncbi:MAG: HAD-IB family phosphatase [Chlorobium limicola]|nr:HAD-IB family phosphatase [Chlorobium limicola]
MNKQTVEWDFFIAHAEADTSTARELYDLMKDQCRVFLDSQCLVLGGDFDVELAAAQRNSMITIVLVSSNTKLAYYQREEIATAINLARNPDISHRVVPLYLEEGLISEKQFLYGLRLKHGLQLSANLLLQDAAKKLIELRKHFPRKNVAAEPDNNQESLQQTEPGILIQPSLNWTSPVQKNQWRYKVAAFDLDGTLLRGDGFEFSWEAVWRYLSFGKSVQNELKRQYRRCTKQDKSKAMRIRAYQEWCNKACNYFKTRNLSRETLKIICKPYCLTNNCREALATLRSEGVVVAIISGGIHTFLEDRFPDYRDYVDFVFINELLFSPSGALTGIHATPFDFEGKAEALEFVCSRVGCTPEEAVFVGDHFNDEAIMLMVNKAIGYPTQDAAVEGVQHESISENDLLLVLPHILTQ